MNKTILYLVSNLFLGPTIFIFVIMLRIRVPYIQRVWYPHRNIKYFRRFEKFSIWIWISFCCTKIYFEFLQRNWNILMLFQYLSVTTGRFQRTRLWFLPVVFSIWPQWFWLWKLTKSHIRFWLSLTKTQNQLNKHSESNRKMNSGKTQQG